MQRSYLIKGADIPLLLPTLTAMKSQERTGGAYSI